MSSLRFRLVPLFVLAAVLSGCASTSGTPAPDAASEAPVTDSGVTTDDGVAITVRAGFGCTDEMLAYLASNGFGDVPPVDPGEFAFPEGVDIAATPTCFVSEDDGQGASRESALFFDDPDGAITQADAAFHAAGWQGEASDSLAGKTGVWWSDGTDAMTARHSVGGGVLEVNGSTAAWFTWAS
ncbi:predicted hydrolase of the HAD superfamily [Microbacterium testaceum StLB037]|uniref:Predicted hydrolase of the HAD superfamily n=1 Tax=Microbacterium testaceum (strain StLB037) TaxID=979556 RepID=E8NA25_MICTS|nr:haloacid dehalogenase [Microbacterium testaceum]BAJ75855.1 predicted hydrolase of the HAD superfamily [Microbacterium testaceum StLB037]